MYIYLKKRILYFNFKIFVLIIYFELKFIYIKLIKIILLSNNINIY